MTAFAWTAHLVTEALGLPLASWDHAYKGLSTDTRTLKDGELFVALQGEKFDAHDYLSDARLAGVGGVIVREGTPRWPGFDWFEVKDTLVALGQLAQLRRAKFTGTVIAVTGSNGKTSTKEMIAAALGVTRKVHKSERNLNNLVGVPLTILAAPLEADAMVVECGASVRGELERMRVIVRPDVAVVTNVGAAHVEGFGSLAAVLEEKVSLLKDAPAAVVGTEPAALPEAARKVSGRVVTAAISGPADWTAESVTMSPDGRASFKVRGVKVELPMRGRHMVANALIALAAADAAGVKLERAVEGLAHASIPGGRSELMEMDGVTVINDTYNANPDSLR
ncbi:MAG: UDP-N-acetylmuramoyl-tripeptide--D-alanyl-D-alanine ligase, partial [Gemmatimonadales bacterium]